MKVYKSNIQRLSESRNAFRRILSEQRKPFDKDGDGKGSPISGFPGQCCENGQCGPVTFQSAMDDCSDIGLQECLPNGTCPPNVLPDDLLGLDDLHTNDDTGNNQMISCVMCMHGTPVSVTQVPAGQPCPPGTQDSHLGDPCDGQNQPCGPNSFTVNGQCATSASMVQQWAGAAGPSNFLANMESGFNQFGCQFLQARLTNHQDQMTNMIFFGPNNPQGYPNPGPLWVAQKQSKIDFLQCIITACCNTGTGPVTVGPTMG
jgi:hypothetical protein|tara:strand:+ start:6014 stop:6793 length:780 start_codon:yes stop_codon:yes gene_type:complete